MYPLVDTHAHLYSEEFDDDRPEVIRRCREASLAVVLLPNTSREYIGRLRETVSMAPDLFVPMIGLEPTDVGEDWEEQLEALERELRTNPGYYRGIGEIGLDYYWSMEWKEQMIEAFRRQVEWARELDLPMSMHTREAVPETVRLLQEWGVEGLRGVFHSFSESEEDLEAILSLGEQFMVGINGIVTFKNSRLRDVIKGRLPLTRLVVETDSPYLSPEPRRGRRNESSHIVHTVRCLAGIYEVSEADMRRQLFVNSRKMFNLAAVTADP